MIAGWLKELVGAGVAWGGDGLTGVEAAPKLAKEGVAEGRDVSEDTGLGATWKKWTLDQT